jgi:hypothetical protein
MLCFSQNIWAYTVILQLEMVVWVMTPRSLLDGTNFTEELVADIFRVEVAVSKLTVDWAGQTSIRPRV